MVKNYLVGSVRPVNKIWYSRNGAGAQRDNPEAEIHLATYKKMYQLSRASAKKFLQGEWDEVLHSAPVLDARMFQIAQWYLVKEMWFREPCNILCMGADTMFVRDTHIFDQFKEMRMFNYTDPRQHDDLRQYHDTQGHYFNDDVRYFPATMDPEIWDIGERHMIDWFTHSQSHWDCGQLINNHMFWNQPTPVESRLLPQFNWMAMNVRDFSVEALKQAEVWNRCPFETAYILHFNGSRGPEKTLEFMSTIAEKMNLDLETTT